MRKSARLISKRKCHVDPVEKLPRELAIKIFSYLKSRDIRNCCLVNKSWASVGQDSQIQKHIIYQEIAFGALKWQRYFGDVGLEPQLPPDIHVALASPCPFFPGKKVANTHMLVLIPKTVNGRPLTLNGLEELMQHPKEGPAAKYHYYWAPAKAAYGETSIAQSYWILMTKDVLEGSRSKSYADQCLLVKTHSQRIKIPYEVPLSKT